MNVEPENLRQSAAALRPFPALPASLTRQFDLLESRLWRLDSLAALTGGLGSLLLSCALQFASDRLWDTPQWLRFLFALCGWTGLLVFVFGYGSHWIWGRRSIHALAVIVQHRYRRLGDRLLGIVELAAPSSRPSNYSAELCNAAIAQVAAEASTFDFKQAAVPRHSRRQLLTFLALALIMAAIAILAPDAGRNALFRWLWPLSDIDRYTFVTIVGLPDHLVVAQGEPFDIAIGLASNSFWRPHTARSHFDGLKSTAVPIRDGIATFYLPGQTQDRFLWLSVGDVTRSVSIRPVVRPDLRQLRVHRTFPSYLEYPPQDQTIDAPNLAFLPGTSATFTGDAVRDLASVNLAGSPPIPITTSGSHFTTGPILLELERNLTFTWRDTLGLAGPGPIAVHVDPIEDQPPQVELRDLQAAIGILPDETAHIDLASSDDFGVRLLSLSWQIASDSPMIPPGPIHEIKIADGQPQAKSLDGHYYFSPSLLGVPAGATAIVRGLAIDYYPGRQTSVSTPYRIHVLTRDAHASLIHDQLEKLLEQLEEITRRESTILQSGKALRTQTAQALAKDVAAQNLSHQSSDQREIAAQLKDLAKQIASTLAEAMRNPEISQDTLKTWAAHAEQMNQLASSSMPSAAQSLDSAKSDPSQRSQNLDQALSKEQGIVAAMRQMQKQAGNDLESLMANTLAGRLRKASTTERDLASSFQQMLPATIGMTPDQLPDDARRQIKQMSIANAEVTREAGRLQEEISRLYDRTTLSRYGDVAHELDSWKAQDALAALGKLVDQNIAVESIDDAHYWSEQFSQWASRLSDSGNSRTQPAAEAGQPNPAALQALLTLMRLRQQQDQLREQTSVIQEQKDSTDNYSSQAKDAAAHQSDLGGQTQSLVLDPTFPVSPTQISPVGKAMADAASLLDKPETGKPTIAAQTDAINLLDTLISQQAQKAGQNAVALVELMGMGGGAGPNTSHTPNVPIPGPREGPLPDPRTVIQAAGIDNSQLPSEFRDAIESYHHAIERSQTP